MNISTCLKIVSPIKKLTTNFRLAIVVLIDETSSILFLANNLNNKTILDRTWLSYQLLLAMNKKKNNYKSKIKIIETKERHNSYKVLIRMSELCSVNNNQSLNL